MADPPRSRIRGYLLALLAATCWASGGLTAKWLFTKPSPETIGWPLPPLGITVDPTALSFARAAMAFALLFAYLLISNRSALSVRMRDLPFLSVFGVVGMAGVHFTYFKTISLTNVATAILLEYLAPVLVLVVSVWFLGQRFTWSLPVGVGLSVIGCALVVGAFGSGGLVVSPQGIMWGLASAIFFAAYSLMGSVAVGRFRPYTLLVWGLGFASLFWLVLLGSEPLVMLMSDQRTALAVFGLALTSTIVPFASFLIALHHIPPTNATVTSTIEPVIAGVGAGVLFGETLGVTQILGGALVLAAIVVVQLPSGSAGPVLPPHD
jgi:drug/metabolite transporter (DMT)-like permease